MLIKAKLLGPPIITIENHEIVFPYKKAEALFYYLMINNKVYRHKAINLLWGDVSESLARKNLRNAIYIIKKSLGFDIFKNSRDFIEISEQYEVVTDYSKIVDTSEEEYLSFYNGEFLEGFYVKNAEIFEEWVFDIRYNTKEIISQRLEKSIYKHIEIGSYVKAEEECRALIEIDNYYEEAYRNLMEIFRRQSKYNQCIKVFKKLSQILDKELSLKPDTKTRQLFDTIMQERNLFIEPKETSEELFIGREKELSFIKKNLYGFFRNHSSNSMIIEGEIGVGKTSLMKQSMSVIDNVDILGIDCYSVYNEMVYSFIPWLEPLLKIKSIFTDECIKKNRWDLMAINSLIPGYIDNESEINRNKNINPYDLNQNSIISRAIEQIFLNVSKQKKLVLFFENINTYDQFSLNLIRNIMLNDKNKNILFVLTSSIGFNSDLEIMISELKSKRLLDEIKMKRFSYREVKELTSKLVNNSKMSEQMIDQIYKESAGNPLFLKEIIIEFEKSKKLVSIPPTISNILNTKYLKLSENAMKIVDIASTLSEEFTFEELLYISGKDDFFLVEIIEEIIKKDFVTEIFSSDYNTRYAFVHQKFKNYIYQRMNLKKRKIIHKKVGDYFESKLRQIDANSMIYNKILHHYNQAGYKAGYLKYKILNLIDYLEINQEIFPIVKKIDFTSEYYTNKIVNQDVENMIENINDIYNELKTNEILIDDEIEMLYLNIMARYYVAINNNDMSVKLINQLLSYAKLMNSIKFTLEGNKLLVYKSINSKNYEFMIEVINKSIELAKKHHLKEQLGIFVRLKGYHHILNGDYSSGERYLFNAIGIFSSLTPKEKYVLNLVASYYYLGVSKQYQGELESAIKFYMDGIEISKKYGYIDRIALIYSSVAQTKFAQNDYELSEKYIIKSIKLYDTYDFRWGKSVAYSYYALLKAKRSDFIGAFDLIKKAEEINCEYHFTNETIVVQNNKKKINEMRDMCI